jgi:hypothetical protein
MEKLNSNRRSSSTMDKKKSSMMGMAPSLSKKTSVISTSSVVQTKKGLNEPLDSDEQKFIETNIGLLNQQ